MTDDKKKLTRRQVLSASLRGAGVIGLAGLGVSLIGGKLFAGEVWQIDPNKCIQCGNCATFCVLNPSAVKCVHQMDLCWYCERCFGFFDPRTEQLDTAAENQLCPLGAITRTYLKHPFFEYSVDEQVCIGCAKCVKGCSKFGNGSLYLQIRHDRCVNCNECAIVAACPADAIKRVSASDPYILKKDAHA